MTTSPDASGAPKTDWLSKLISIIPNIRGVYQFGAYTLVILLCILIFVVKQSGLAALFLGVAFITPILIVTNVQHLKGWAADDRGWWLLLVTILCSFLLSAFSLIVALVIILAPPRQGVAYANGGVASVADSIANRLSEEGYRVEFSDPKIGDLVLCVSTSEPLRASNWMALTRQLVNRSDFRNCLGASFEGMTVKFTRRSGNHHFERDDSCDVCKPGAMQQGHLRSSASRPG